MALGGGTFLTQNKILPGAYINFISLARASAQLSDRGYGALPLMLDWGPDGEVFTVDTADFQKESLQIFGYSYIHEKLMPLRDFFKYAKTGYFYRLNSGEKAKNSLAVAACSGTRGNDIKIIVQVNVDEPEKFDVTTLLDGSAVDCQTVSEMKELVDNAYVKWIRTATLTPTAGMPLTGGTNNTSVTGTQHQEFLEKIESYSFNALGCPSAVSTIADLYAAFTQRMRDEVGAKFQTVVYNKGADYEGVINLKAKPVGDGVDQAALVYWMTGASAGCAVNKSNSNRIYNGEYTVFTGYKQRELEESIRKGEMLFHRVGSDVRVLDDINSLVTTTQEKNDDFKSNQTIRVLDQLGNDTAVLFNTKYNGQFPNNASGRVSLWSDIVKLDQELLKIEAIEEFAADDVTVEPGETKKAVAVTNSVKPVNAMTQLYMNTIVR